MRPVKNKRRIDPRYFLTETADRDKLGDDLVAEVSQLARTPAFDPNDPESKGGGLEQTTDKAEMLRSFIILADEGFAGSVGEYVESYGLTDVGQHLSEAISLLNEGDGWKRLHQTLAALRQASGGSATF